MAQANVRVHLALDGAPLAMVLASSTGAFVYDVPTDLAVSEHLLSASAEVLGVRSQVSTPVRFSVGTPSADGGTPDAGSPDAGTPDSGAPDSGTPDAGTPDAGTPDGGGHQPPPDGGSQEPGEKRPVVVVPAEGERVGPMPLLAGTAPGAETVGLEVDGSEVAQVTVDAQGRFRYTLSAEQALGTGAHRVTARTYEATGAVRTSSPPTSFEVATQGDVGCGCGASPGAGLGAVALLLGTWASRRRRAA
jgi:uncharacterized protein (TIGR03382 family)